MGWVGQLICYCIPFASPLSDTMTLTSSSPLSLLSTTTISFATSEHFD